VWHGRAGWYHHPLDVEVMQRAATMLLGEHDFSAFRAADCQAKSPIKMVRHASVQRSGELIVFDFEAGAFLHHMVRNLVGSLVYIGQDKHPAEWITELLESRDRRRAAPTFSAAGLYLAGVSYEAHWGLPANQDALLSGAIAL
jgi:tRNA pseudouridine38-40 synthase